MIHYAEVNGKKYPFKIGMREHQLLYKNAISINGDISGLSEEEAQKRVSIDYNEVLRKVTTDFDTFLEMFHLASKKGCRHHEKETGEKIEPLTPIEIEDAVDDDPDLYVKLQDIFIESTATGSKKKPKNQKKS